MQITKTKFDGLYILEPKLWGDDRGYFFESYSQQTLAEAGIDIVFVQDNEAMSTKGVLRGLHYQVDGSAQSKLVRVSKGEVLDVAVDIRPQSPTYGQHISVIISDKNKKQMLIPKGFAHGYVVLSETAVFQYKCDTFYDREAEGGVLYSDAQLAIDWILPQHSLTISDKDKKQPTFGSHKAYV